MPERLIIRLNSDPAGLHHWIRLRDGGEVDGHAESGPLERAAEAAKGCHVVALAPAVEVALLSARIPTQSRQRMLKAVPFALEDQLADEIENLHFALGRRGDDERLAVAVVNKARLQQWIDQATEAGFQLDQIYPEPLALPYEEGAWTVLVEGDRCVVRTGPQSGFGGDADNVSMLVEWALAEHEGAPPERLLYYSAEDNIGLEGAGLPPVEEREFPHTTLLLATSLDERSAIGLRTGEFAAKSARTGFGKGWQVAAGLLVAWALVDTGAAYLRAYALESHRDELWAQTAALYKDAFPSGGMLMQIDPKAQIESRLNALRQQAGGDTGFLKVLAAVAPTLAGDRQIQLSGLNYRNGDLSVEFYAKTLQDVDALKQRLAALQGISVEVERARADGDRVQGQLRIEASS